MNKNKVIKILLWLCISTVIITVFSESSPLYKLNQGYSFVSDREGNGIISTKQVHSGDLLEISVTDGVIEAEVRSSRKEDWNK